jgi:arylsulfatase A-like enzyme
VSPRGAATAAPARGAHRARRGGVETRRGVAIACPPRRAPRRPGAGGAVLLLAALLGALPAAAAPLAVAIGEGVRVQPFSAYGAARDRVVSVRAPAAFSATVDVPVGARLVTAVAVPDRVWTASTLATAAPLRFRILFQSDGETVTLYDRTIDIVARAGDRRWYDLGRDLAPFAGRRGTLRFETTPARADAPPTLGVWALPEMVTCTHPGPSLLLVTIDALRADHLSSAGYVRPTTPRLDAFAAGATRFTAGFAAAPKTIPSIPQILTGRYFPAHGEGPGLAPLLGTGRFELTRAVVNNPYVVRWLDGEQPHFQTRIGGDLDARQITSEALRFLTAAGRCRTALYLHYLDTHTPYHAPARWARRFVDRNAATTVGLTFADVTGAWQDKYGPVDRRRIVDLYDGSIAWTDRQLGRLFRGLARRGRLPDTVVIVTADHGEEFWDHGRFFHGQSLYDELLHVPLIVHLPHRGRGRVVDSPVSTVDLLPTIAEAAGLPDVARDGRSLVPLVAGAAEPEADARTVFATVSYAEPRTPPRQAVRSRDAKLIHNVEDGTYEVYDLAHDRGERRNLGPDAPVAGALRATLDTVRTTIAAAGDQLRLRSTRNQPTRYVVTLISSPSAPIVDVDRLTLEAGDWVVTGARAGALTLRGVLEPGGEDQIRMDVRAPNGTLGVRIALDDAPAPPGTLRLGPSGRPGGPAVDLADPALVGDPPAVATADAAVPPVTVSFWRVPASSAQHAPAPLDPATRERLRQLGYVD